MLPTECCERAESTPVHRLTPTNLLIAAQAHALGYSVVTDNDKEFARVKDLRCENWLR
jgi:predicted nucleic acid-binding protein